MWVQLDAERDSGVDADLVRKITCHQPVNENFSNLEGQGVVDLDGQVPGNAG